MDEQLPLTEVLTERELDVLRLLATDLTNAEIADKLFVSRTTVRFHNKNIYSKLGVSSREEAVAKATELGLLQDETTSPTRHNLPAQTTPFIGRQAELNELSALLADEHIRLVTILAPGGMGKTRLALEVAGQFAGLWAQSIVPLPNWGFPDGVFFVPLAPISSSDDLVTTIADALEFRFHANDEPKQQLLDFLQDQRLLLLLDNFEHLLDGAIIVSNILQAAPQVRILATSRERLGLSGEKVYSVSGMVFPDWETPEDALEYDAVKLFLQGAQLVSSDFQLHQDNLKYLARICRLTEGMPLAIVLAAAWVDVLSLQEIADEIQHSIDFLSAEMRDLPRRQWSIRAVYEPTWKRLTDEEKTVFMRFAVFRGGCTREAAQAVTGATLRHLQAFVNKALLTRTAEGRYEIHELVRQYVAEQLDASGLSEETSYAHAQYYATFIAQRDTDIKGHRQHASLMEIKADFLNVRRMWNTSVVHRRFEIVEQAVETFFWYGIFDLRFEELEVLLQVAENALVKYEKDEHVERLKPQLQARILFAQRWRYGNYKQPEASQQQLAQCLEWAQLYENAAEIALYQLLLAEAATQVQDLTEAMAMYEKALTNFRTLGDRFYIAWTLHLMSLSVAYSSSDNVNLTKGLLYMRQALAIRNEIGDKIGICNCYYNIGSTLASLGDIDGAAAYFQETRTVSDIDSQWTDTLTLGNISYLFFLRGDFEEARRMSTLGLEANRRSAFQLGQAMSLWTLGILACVDRDYLRAKAICEECLAIAPRPTHRFGGYWGLALAYYGLGDYGAAMQANHDALRFAFTSGEIGKILWCFPAAAVIEVHHDNKDRAVELLSMAFNHPLSVTGWIERWELISQLRSDLEDELGSEAYQAAWERGKTLDLEIVARELVNGYREQL